MFSECQWFNEPARWNLGPNGLFVVTDNATDFWRVATMSPAALRPSTRCWVRIPMMSDSDSD